MSVNTGYQPKPSRPDGEIIPPKGGAGDVSEKDYYNTVLSAAIPIAVSEMINILRQHLPAGRVDQDLDTRKIGASLALANLCREMRKGRDFFHRKS